MNHNPSPPAAGGGGQGQAPKKIEAYQCNLCPAVFGFKFNAKRHFQKLHPEDEYDSSKIANIKFKCYGCQWGFDTYGNLEAHFAQVHQGQTLNPEKVYLGDSQTTAATIQSVKRMKMPSKRKRPASAVAIELHGSRPPSTPSSALSQPPQPPWINVNNGNLSDRIPSVNVAQKSVALLNGQEDYVLMPTEDIQHETIVDQANVKGNAGQSEGIDPEVFDASEEDARLGNQRCENKRLDMSWFGQENVDGSQKRIDLLNGQEDDVLMPADDIQHGTIVDQIDDANANPVAENGLHQTFNESFSQYFDLKDMYQVPSVKDISLSESIDLFADDVSLQKSPNSSQITKVKFDSQDSTFIEFGTQRNSGDTNKPLAKPKAKKIKIDNDQVTQSQSQRSKGLRTRRQRFVQCKSVFREGTWVQCSKISCHKWRYLKFIQNPDEVPDTWTCEQNFDPKYSDCQVAQDPEYNGVQYVDADFIVGTIKWVKLESFPAWPAIIDDNQDTKTSIWISENDIAKGNEAMMTKCHVVFFDSLNGTVTRSWVPTSCTQPFYGNESMKRFPSLDDETYENLRNALANARRASRMTLDQRRRMYCTLYKKKHKKARKHM